MRDHFARLEGEVWQLQPPTVRKQNFTGYRDREGRARYPFKIFRIARDGSGLLQIVSGESPDI